MHKDSNIDNIFSSKLYISCIFAENVKKLKLYQEVNFFATVNLEFDSYYININTYINI